MAKTDTWAPAGVTLSQLVPRGANLLVRELQPAEATRGGFIIPRSALAVAPEDMLTVAQPPSVGVVVRQGAGCEGSWLIRGQAVVYLPNSGVTFDCEDESWIVFEEGCVLGVVPYEEPA